MISYIIPRIDAGGCGNALSTKEKRIKKLRDNYLEWSIEDVDWLLVMQAGCNYRQAGSHKIYWHPQIESEYFVGGVNVPVNKPIKSPYAKKAMAYFDELLSEQE